MIPDTFHPCLGARLRRDRRAPSALLRGASAPPNEVHAADGQKVRHFRCEPHARRPHRTFRSHQKADAMSRRPFDFYVTPTWATEQLPAHLRPTRTRRPTAESHSQSAHVAAIGRGRALGRERMKADKVSGQLADMSGRTTSLYKGVSACPPLARITEPPRSPESGLPHRPAAFRTSLRGHKPRNKKRFARLRPRSGIRGSRRRDPAIPGSESELGLTKLHTIPQKIEWACADTSHKTAPSARLCLSCRKTAGRQRIPRSQRRMSPRLNRQRRNRTRRRDSRSTETFVRSPMSSA